MPERVIIENPVINSPFDEPKKHFVFGEDGITDEIAEERRGSSYFIPIPPPKKKSAQAVLPDTQWTLERIRMNDFINQVRSLVSYWRAQGHPGVTPATRDLLGYWTDPTREKRLFFCQIEALEAAIYLTEVAPKAGEQWIENRLKEEAQRRNPDLFRVAFKMATGSGKTVVMAMLIGWQTLNKLANPQDKRFSDAFLIVSPGITIRDRLRVLLPNDPNNYYRERDILPPEQLVRLQQAKIVITNFHQFIRRDKFDVASLTKKVLAGPEGDMEKFKETPDEMVRRVCRSFGSKKNIVVINDEAHHCYREKPPEESEERKIESDEQTEVKQNAEAARVWITGLEAVKKKLGVKIVYDLSATPFFLRGSGYPEGTLFPWVVSDFSLIDAIESGIVKVPRVPVADDQVLGTMPTYRDLWVRIRDDLPKKGRKTEAVSGEPRLPAELEGALRSLYGNYEKAYRKWEAAGVGTPPVFIVVCNNTNVSKLAYDWLAGWEKQVGTDGHKIVIPGNLEVFSNERDGGWSPRPNTLLIDSAQLESGGQMDDNFKRAAAAEIEEFKSEYRQRFPGANVDDITDEDLLREVMNTIGKPGRLGEYIKCVVSVSMLTEGWDATTVTHILGVRAFGTQLLCEQVVGRGLRRMSYEAGDDGMFEPEYAEVYGVPFSFIPTSGSNPDPTPPKPVHHVYALPERAEMEITFPRLSGYRYAMPTERLTANFTEESVMVLSTQQIPTLTEMDPIAGTPVVHTLDDLRTRREQEVAFKIAQAALEGFFRDEDLNVKPWLFPQLVEITKRWMGECVRCKDNAFPQMLVLDVLRQDAASKVYLSVVKGTQGEKRIMPLLRPYDPIGSTANVSFDTTKSVMNTEKSHLNYVVADSNWEHKMTESLESMPEVICYVKNQGLGLFIPYTFEGNAGNYMPDFIVRIDDGETEPLNLIVEVSGQVKRDKTAKVEWATTHWVPAVNNHGGFGRWRFIEVTDPWDAKNLI